MRILLAAVEMTPYVKVGGVADVIYHWAKTLSERGHEVTVVLPSIMPDSPAPPPWLDLQNLSLEEFSPEDPYAHEEDYHGTYAGRLRRLSGEIISLCETRAKCGRPFDILHVNEWPVSLLPFLLLNCDLDFPRPGTVLTIHSVIYRGVLPAWAFEQFGADPLGPPRIVDETGLIRPLAAGIASADVLTTPSPTYAREITRRQHRDVLGQDIFETLVARANDIHGILHGLDRDEWNPSSDMLIPFHYDDNDLSGKAECKTSLETELDLAGEPGSPVVLSAGRLCAAKGTELLLEVLPDLCRRGVRIVIAGTGKPAYERMVHEAVARAPQGYVRYVGWADTAMLHRLYASADIVALPSLHEACGLTQMEAQRYGTIPVVHKCGGFNDTVIDHASDSLHSTGFGFESPDVAKFLAALDNALNLIGRKECTELRRRCMNAPPGWDTAIKKYEHIYRMAIETKEKNAYAS